MSDGEDAPLGWRTLVRAAVIGLVALGSGAAAGYLIGREPPPGSSRPGPSAPAPPAEAGEEVLALFSPLRPGSELAGYRLARVHPVEAGVIRLELARGETRVALGVALAGGDAAPPVVAGRYAVFYFGQTGDEVLDAVRALGEVLKANAAKPPPPGLATLRARPDDK